MTANVDAAAAAATVPAKRGGRPRKTPKAINKHAKRRGRPKKVVTASVARDDGDVTAKETLTTTTTSEMANNSQKSTSLTETHGHTAPRRSARLRAQAQ